jgi:hypothetical protein
MWINPRQSGLTPKYGSIIGNAEHRRNQWLHMVSDVNGTSGASKGLATGVATGSGVTPPILINQDANIYVAEIPLSSDANTVLPLEILPKRQAYLLCVEGTAQISILSQSDKDSIIHKELQRHDAAELLGPLRLTIKRNGTTAGLHLLVVEMNYVGEGRRDLHDHDTCSAK